MPASHVVFNRFWFYRDGLVRVCPVFFGRYMSSSPGSGSSKCQMQAEQSQARLPDASKENLFVELVAKGLKFRQMEPWHDPDVRDFGDDSVDGDFGGSFDFRNVANRLHSLETYVVKLDAKLDFLVQCQQQQQAHVAEVRVPLSSAPRSPMSSSSTHTSPSPSNRHNFQCPLCLVPQFTPKSHCEHMRNTVDSGAHNCRFDAEHKRHDHILKLWGSGTAFVRWYTSFLRSGMGRNFTERDIKDYESLQSVLTGILNGSVVLQRE